MEQTRHIRELDQIADLLHENARLRALVEKRERQIVWCVRNGATLIDYYIDYAADGEIKFVKSDGTDAGLLAAIDKATGETTNG